MARGKFMPPGEPDGVSTRPMHMIETFVVPEGTLGSIPADWDADRAVTALYG